MKKFVKTLCTGLAFMVLALGVLPGATAETVATLIEVEDSLDRELTLEAPATEIVATLPSDAEILYALGAGDTLVGRGSYVDYPSEVSEVPDVGSGQETNIEAIIALDPDLVVLGQMSGTEDQIRQLEEAGIPVFVSDADTIEDVYVNIEKLAYLTGYEEAGQELIAEMEATFDHYEDLADDQEPGTVYYEISPLEFGLWAAGDDTFMNELGDLLNLDNIFEDDFDGWSEVSEEQVLAKDPDYIITTSMPVEGAPSPVEEILQREAWQDVTAVKEGQVFQVSSDEFTRPGPRLMYAIEALYDFVYGAN